MLLLARILLLQAGNDHVVSLAVQSETVDDALVLVETEHARRRVSRLRLRRDSANLHKGETALKEFIDGLRLLVKARRDTDALRELQTHDGGFQLGIHRLVHRS